MNELSKMRWRCRRGMRELDVVLIHYLETTYASADCLEQQAFVNLLDLPDIDIYSYLIGQQTPDDALLLTLIEKMRQLYAAQLHLSAR